MQLTQEQQTIIETAKKYKNIAIQATAGSAKTTTCMMVAEQLDEPSLYVAYNKAIAEEASKKFPEHVQCKTMHSIAWYHVVRTSKGYRSKLSGFFNRKHVIENCPGFDSIPSSGRGRLVYGIIENVENFCNTAYSTIEEYLDSMELDRDSFTYMETCNFWKAVVDPTNDCSMTHNVYLKLFQLKKPYLNYDMIYIDEAQDLNPAILDIILNQPAQKLFVGDLNQAIYGFNNCVNGFEFLDDSFVHLKLSNSFRLNKENAEVANTLLSIYNDDPFVITGLNEQTEIKTRAVLARSNLDIYKTLLHCAESAIKVHVIGGINDLVTALFSAMALRSGNRDKIYDKFIKTYDSFQDYVDDADNIADIRKVLTILQKSDNIFNEIAFIKEMLCDDPREAELVIATGHKAKGLEFDEVTVLDGYVMRHINKIMEDDKEISEEEAIRQALSEDQNGNLLFVAITRARVKLNLSEELQYVLSSVGEEV